MPSTEREPREEPAHRGRTPPDVSELHVPASRPVAVVRFRWGGASSTQLRGIDVGLRWKDGRDH